MRNAFAWIVMLLAAVALLGGCLSRYVPVNDAQVSAALQDVLDQYQKRGELARSLATLVQPVAGQTDALDMEVAAAQASLDRLRATPQAQLQQVDFERFETVQRQLSDAISRVLIESGNDRQLRQDPRFRSLRRRLAAVDRRIASGRLAYNEAVDRYNAGLAVFPYDVEARMLALHARARFDAPDKTAKRPPRTDFGALRGSLQV
jgi:LemA protein